MTVRPIIFSPSMVQALLSGRKFQTRRIISFSGIDKVIDFVLVGFDKETGAPIYEMRDAHGKALTRPVGKNFVDYHFSPRWASSDLLYVRERGAISRSKTAFEPYTGNEKNQDNSLRNSCWPKSPDGKPYKPCPSIHMPRWASRMTLNVRGVRIERLQSCSREDAIAEGVVEDDGDVPDIYYVPGSGVMCRDNPKKPKIIQSSDPVEVYASLWDHINGEGAWASNPFVAAITFDVIHKNIDQL